MWPWGRKGAQVGKSESKEKPAGRVPTIKTVRNAGNQPEIIGRVELKPGEVGAIDISPGTIGAELLKRGVLVEDSGLRGKTTGHGKSNAGASFAHDSGQDQTVVYQALHQYQCPWCEYASESAEEAQTHIAQAHGHEILRRVYDEILVTGTALLHQT